MTFYSYGLTVEQQPGALTFNKSLAAASADSAAATTRKGPNPLLLGVKGTQFVGPGGGDPFSGDFSPDFGGGGAGYVLVSVSKLARASNAATYVLTAAKFASHFPVLQTASAQVASLLRPYRGQRLLQSASGGAAVLSLTHPYHAVVAATQTNVPRVGRLISKGIRSVSAQAVAVLRGISHGLSMTSPQAQVTGFAHGPGLVRGVAGSSVVGALKSIGRILSTLHLAQAALSHPPGRVLGAVSASAVGIARRFPYHVSGVTSAAAVLLGFGGGNLYTRVFGVASGAAPLLGRGMSVYRPAASAETARLLKTPGRLLGVASASAVGALKAVGRLLGAASTSVVGAAVRLPNIVRGVASGSASALLHPRLVGSLAAFVVAQAENVLAVTQHVVGRPLALPRTQTASVSISAVVSYLRALVVPQGQAAAAASPRSLLRFFATASSAAQVSVRSIARSLFVKAPEASAFLSTAQHSLVPMVASTMAAFLRASHALTRGVGSIEAVAVVPLRLRNTIVGTLNGSAVALRRGIAHPLAVLGSQAMAMNRAIGKAIALPGASAVSLSRLLFRFPATASSQAAGLIPRYGSKIGGVVSANAAALLRGTAKLAGSLTRQVAASGRIDFKIVGATLGNVASMIRPRGFHLGAVQSQIAAVVDWFHLFVPDWASQQTVLLPPGGGPAEPPDFGPIDPLDETTFAFNWSSRADPNDPIVSATVVSVPPGLTFGASPVFISGTLVQVTVVPSMPPLLPSVYKLRCTAIFASGRRSSFSIPVPVRIL